MCDREKTGLELHHPCGLRNLFHNMYTVLGLGFLEREERDIEKGTEKQDRNINRPPSDMEWISKGNKMGKTSLSLEPSKQRDSWYKTQCCLVFF